METKRKCRTFDRQFKMDAVDLVIKQGRSNASVARDLGIDSQTLANWKRDVEANRAHAFPGNGNPHDAEMHKLKRELAIAQEERDILKKALAVFSRRPQ